MAALAAAVIAILLGIELSLHITAPVTNVVSTLDSKAHKDLLTGLLNKRSFEETAGSALSSSLSLSPRAIILLDLDNFKGVNDTLGHERGDQFIIDACMIICRHFKHSPVFRIGGDEFVVLLERDDFDNRAALADSFNQNMDSPDSSEQPIIIAMGMTDFISGSDASFNDVFVRADKLMYERKHELKNSRSV